MKGTVKECVEILCSEGAKKTVRAEAIIKLLALTTDHRVEIDDRDELADAAIDCAFSHTQQFRTIVQREVDSLISGMRRFVKAG